MSKITGGGLVEHQNNIFVSFTSFYKVSRLKVVLEKVDKHNYKQTSFFMLLLMLPIDGQLCEFSKVIK